MIKRLLLGGGIALVALAGFVFVAERRALAALDDLGVRYERLERGLFSRTLYDLQYRSVTIGRVSASLLQPRKVKASDIHVRIQPESGSGQLGSEAPNPLPEDITASLHAVSLSWDGDTLIDGLSGSLENGRVILDGDGVHLSSGADLFEIDWSTLLPGDWASGEANVQIQRGGRIKIIVSVPDLVVDHPLLHGQPVSVGEALIALEGDRLARSLRGTLSVGGVESELTVQREDKQFLTDLVFGPMPLSEALVPLHSVVPEAPRAQIDGSISAQAQLEWPSKEWTGNFFLESIDVDGAVPTNLQSLKRGRFQHRVVDEVGDPVLRTSGEGSQNWISLREIAPAMRHAVIASEDIRFTQHNGFDLEAMHDALEANQRAGVIDRGGSTLSQQLAKNLFLDGQRTLIRKLRELLLAVEMDRSLGKGRILELYLNVVEWGPGIHGISQASERYFMRRPSQLRPNEAAFLAAILPSPRRFYREQYLRERARETRIDWILENMGNANRLSPPEVDYWTQAPLQFVPPPRESR
ncbi:MAG: monofunctional biosynthetic peptidoglycan transglycosylase [Myxococcota bacterium]|nr:monofunctional biosynthetic peptidoglycan transglycosylase [Myxococcota bacterium]